MIGLLMVAAILAPQALGEAGIGQGALGPAAAPCEHPDIGYCLPYLDQFVDKCLSVKSHKLVWDEGTQSTTFMCMDRNRKVIDVAYSPDGVMQPESPHHEVEAK